MPHANKHVQKKCTQVGSNCNFLLVSGVSPRYDTKKVSAPAHTRTNHKKHNKCAGQNTVSNPTLAFWCHLSFVPTAKARVQTNQCGTEWVSKTSELDVIGNKPRTNKIHITQLTQSVACKLKTATSTQIQETLQT